MELVKRVLTALVLIPLVLLLVLRAPVAVLALVAAVIALLAIHELFQLSQAYGIRPLQAPTYVLCGLFFLLLALYPGATDLLSTAGFTYFALSFAVLGAFIFLAAGMRRDPLASGFPAVALSAFAFLFIAVPMGSLVQLRQQWEGSFLVLYLLVLVWAGDIFAYFIGKPFGRHSMSPRISPHKTWEGAFASLLASIGVGIAMFHYAPSISRFLLEARLIEQRDGIFSEPRSLIPVLVLSVVLNVAAQLGDLGESLIKRGAGAKDSGRILPGHGGMLDRIDALLFAAPVLWCYAAWRVMMQ
ncbi:MAG: phosphatidate cytidylyltransferase [Acidobacteria bacterium]|nr:phosphatidate cytidylyltransferase [Acidobacteriota bacterium]